MSRVQNSTASVKNPELSLSRRLRPFLFSSLPSVTPPRCCALAASLSVYLAQSADLEILMTIDYRRRRRRRLRHTELRAAKQSTRTCRWAYTSRGLFIHPSSYERSPVYEEEEGGGKLKKLTLFTTRTGFAFEGFAHGPYLHSCCWGPRDINRSKTRGNSHNKGTLSIFLSLWSRRVRTNEFMGHAVSSSKGRLISVWWSGCCVRVYTLQGQFGGRGESVPPPEDY